MEESKLKIKRSGNRTHGQESSAEEWAMRPPIQNRILLGIVQNTALIIHWTTGLWPQYATQGCQFHKRHGSIGIVIGRYGTVGLIRLAPGFQGWAEQSVSGGCWTDEYLDCNWRRLLGYVAARLHSPAAP